MELPSKQKLFLQLAPQYQDHISLCYYWMELNPYSNTSLQRQADSRAFSLSTSKYEKERKEEKNKTPLKIPYIFLKEEEERFSIHCPPNRDRHRRGRIAVYDGRRAQLLTVGPQKFQQIQSLPPCSPSPWQCLNRNIAVVFTFNASPGSCFPFPE